MVWRDAVPHLRSGIDVSKMRVVMIVNPVAGKGVAGQTVSAVTALLRREGCDLDVQHTKASGDATALAERAADESDVIIAVGGDGTVCEVVAGLIGRSVPVVVIPGGTENLLARELGMGRDPGGVLATVLSGGDRAQDVGVVNDRLFLMMTGIGWDGEVVARMAARRRGPISRWSYVGPLWATLLDYSFPRIRVEVDGGTVFDGRGLVFVGVMPCYALGLRVLRDAIADDGLLDICVLPCSSRRELLAHAGRVLAGRHAERNGVIYLRSNTLHVSSGDDVRMQCDGDTGGVLPASFSMRPSGALFRLPPVGGGRLEWIPSSGIS